MIEFKVIENLKPNKDLTDILKDFKYNEISNKQFYIKEHNQKYNIKEIAHFLKNF